MKVNNESSSFSFFPILLAAMLKKPGGLSKETEFCACIDSLLSASRLPKKNSLPLYSSFLFWTREFVLVGGDLDVIQELAGHVLQLALKTVAAMTIRH